MILSYLSVVTAAAAEQVTAVGAGRVFVADAARSAEDALLGVLDAIVGRLVDVDELRLAQSSDARPVVAGLSLRFRRRLLVEQR